MSADDRLVRLAVLSLDGVAMLGRFRHFQVASGARFKALGGFEQRLAGPRRVPEMLAFGGATKAVALLRRTSNLQELRLGHRRGVMIRQRRNRPACAPSHDVTRFWD